MKSSLQSRLPNPSQNTDAPRLSACVHAPAGAPFPLPGNKPGLQRAEIRDAGVLQAPLQSMGTRVLVVDDEKSIRTTLRTILQNAGYAVEIAGDAAQAHALLANGKWDVVVTDIVLPGLSGVDLLKTIRDTDPDVQVLMMTGEPTVTTAAEAVRAGARDYLIKPVDKKEMLQAVATAALIKQIIDEKRGLEASNRLYQQDLEKQVASRTQALQDTNQRLESALIEFQRVQDELIKRERLSALGQMVSGIAHDFNNALVPIVGFSNLILVDPDASSNPEQLRIYLTAIRTSAAAAADVVRRMREFYRPEEALQITQVDLGKLVDNVMLLTEPAWKVQAQAAGRTICFINDVASGFLIPANEPRLREALINLVLNAVAAMPGGGTLRFNAERLAASVLLRISDTGTGMSDEVCKRCFEPFFSTKGTLGCGLGLSMVYGIVTRHGGQITVESEIGKGATFIMRLPLARERPNPSQPCTPAAGGESVPVFKILLVDDEKWARILSQRFLTLKGHTVLTAATGLEALAIFRREPVDLVITDRAMPDLSGDQFAVEIKRISPATPVIMLTGFGDIMEIQRECPPGVDHVIGKPFTPEQLQEVVLRAMQQRQT